MRKRRVAVTGATGFIGWHVAERFRDAGWDVLGIVRPSSRHALPPGIERVRATLNAADLGRHCEGLEAIVHLAGVTRARSAAQYRRVNVEGTRQAAEAARTLSVRLVHISSQAAGGAGSAAHPRTETDPPQPMTEYGFSKLESERLVRSINGLRWTILRPTAVYGPRDRLFLPLFRLARRGVFPLLNASFACNLIHVDDVARAIETATVCSSAESQLFFVGQTENVTLERLLIAVASAVGRPYRPLRVPYSVAWAAAIAGSVQRRLLYPFTLGSLDLARLKELRSEGFACSVEKAERLLQFEAAIGLDEGFQRTAAWYREHGWLE